MSEPISGTFDCAKLQEIKAKAEIIFADDTKNAEYIPEVAAAIMVLENQTAKLDVLKNPEKDRDLKIYWMDDCDDDDPASCTDDCDISGDEIGDNCQNLVMTECFEKEFTMSEKKYRGLESNMDEEMAKNMAKKMKLMDEFWAKKIIAFINANAGVNAYPGQYTVAGDETFIPAAGWNPDLFGYLATAMAVNKLPNAKVLTGTNLYQYWWKIMHETGNVNNTGDKAKFSAFGTPYFDLFKLEDVVGSKSTFLVNPNAVAMATKVYNKPEGREIFGSFGKQVRGTIGSFSLPGVTYDIIVQEKCSSNDITQSVRLMTKGGIFLNPIGCNGNRTGILKFTCGSGS